MKRVTRVGVLSLGKVMGGAGVCMGAIIGFIYLFVGIGFAVAGMDNGIGFEAAGIGLLAFLFAPVLYGVFSFVFGLIYGVILNQVFRFTGGLELEIEG